MPDNPIIQNCNRKINEAVCIDTKRIYDSCVSKDCLEDLRVTFFGASQRLIDEATPVKCRNCVIKAVSIDVDEVPFNRGFYSANVHFYFMLCFDCYNAPCSTPQVAVGYTDFEKKCILYGSEGDVKILHQIFAMRERTAPKHRSTQTQPQRCKPLTRLCFQAKLWKPATAPFRYAPASLKALCKAQTRAEFPLRQAEPCL